MKNYRKGLKYYNSAKKLKSIRKKKVEAERQSYFDKK